MTICQVGMPLGLFVMGYRGFWSREMAPGLTGLYTGILAFSDGRPAFELGT
jgi:hypothetical protein